MSFYDIKDNIDVVFYEITTNRFFYAFLVFFVFFVLRKYVVTRIFQWIDRRFSPVGNEKTDKEFILEHIFNATKLSVRNLFLLVGIIIATFVLKLEDRWETVLMNFWQTLVVFFLGYAGYNATSVMKTHADRVHRAFGERIEKVLVEFAIKIIQGLVIVTTLLLILQQWGIQVSTFIAGLGIGGLAFALAARDLIANVFAGIVVITDKPYSIGDWIESPYGEGVVEEISFRSTKIRTFANSLITVPNSKVVDNNVTNWSRMRKRQINFRLGVTYSTTPERLRNVVSKIESMLRNHAEIHQDVIFVRFTEFNDSSLDIMIYCFTHSTIWGEYLATREDVLLQIMEILKNEGVEIAFPSRSLYFEKKLIQESV